MFRLHYYNRGTLVWLQVSWFSYWIFTLCGCHCINLTVNLCYAAYVEF